MSDIINRLNINIDGLKRVLIGILVFMVFFLFILLVRTTFAQVTPVKEVNISSVNSSYKDEVGGSFNINESVKWLTNNEAKVTFTISSNPYENGKSKDIILVVNDSNFVSKNSFNKLKDGLKSNIKSMLNNSNKVSLITYNNKAVIRSDFTDNYNELIRNINNISFNRGTNYYDALCKVDYLLRNRKSNRDVVVLMIMNSYPTINSPLEVSEYNYLKDSYKNINITGIQYDLGNKVIDEVDNVTDDSYISNSDNISKYIKNSIKLPINYEEFNIEEIIDNNYFDISSDIDTSIGKVKINKNKINWNLDNKLISGFDATMSFNIKLIDKYKDIDGIFNVSKEMKVKSKIGELEEKFNSKNSPIIQNNYDVIYDPNAPKGCVLKDIPVTKSYSIFDTVKLENKELECKGYQFKGWEVVDKVKKINDDYFIMGEDNVLVRGTWSKMKVSLSMEGNVHKSLSLYDLLKSNELKDSYSNGIHSMSNTKKPIYYYKGKSNNNLIFGGYCWNIVRSTNTEGVKIIFNGVQNNNKCVNTGVDYLMNSYNFNSNSSSLSDLSYTYGDKINIKKINHGEYKFSKNIKYINGVYKLIDSKDDITNDMKYSCFSEDDTCRSVNYITSYDDNNIYYLTLNGENSIDELLNNVFGGNENSNIKYYIDRWYINNLYRYRNYIEDTVYCNDRRLDDNFEFETYNRVKNKNISLECNKRDSYTVSNKLGNGELTYPVGMLSVDEYLLSAGSIDNGSKFYLMSPYKYDGNSYVFSGNKGELVSNSSINVRPVVSLKGNVKIVDGMGTKDNPYIIRLI